MRFFDTHKFYQNEYNNCSKVSMEMIDDQRNDYIVEALANQFRTIINSDITNNDSIFTNKKTLDAIKNIDNYVYERFGFRICHVKAKGIGYACYPVAPNHYNVLNRDVEEETQLMEKYLRDFDKENIPSDPTKTPKDAYQNIDTILKRLIAGRKTLNEYLKSNSLFIDLRKAKISNLPSDFVAYVLTDFHLLFRIYKLNEYEAVSVLLHEIGHIFTHLEYSHRIANTTQVLVDTVKDIVIKQNNSTKENLRIIYEKTTKAKVPPEFSKMNNITAAIYIGKNILNRNLSAQDHSFTDSEQLADQFAGKFGMGSYLVTALDKMYGIDDSLTYMKSLYYMSQSELFIILLVLTIASCFTMGAALVFIPIYLALFTSMLVWFTLFRKSYASEETLSDGMVYDDLKRRYIRNKNELIRQLNTKGLPKEVENSIYRSIRVIEKSIQKIPDAHNGLIDKFLLWLSDDKKFIVNSKRTEQILEDIMSNDAHMGKVLIKNLI